MQGVRRRKGRTRGRARWRVEIRLTIARVWIKTYLKQLRKSNGIEVDFDYAWRHYALGMLDCIFL
jgi:hypothetical protein